MVRGDEHGRKMLLVCDFVMRSETATLMDGYLRTANVMSMSRDKAMTISVVHVGSGANSRLVKHTKSMPGSRPGSERVHQHAGSTKQILA